MLLIGMAKANIDPSYTSNFVVICFYIPNINAPVMYNNKNIITCPTLLCLTKKNSQGIEIDSISIENALEIMSKAQSQKDQ